MESNYQKVISSWRIAAVDLGVIIDADFSITGSPHLEDVYLHIRDYGSPNGTLILSMDNCEKQDELMNLGFYCSALNFEIYASYSRELFIDTLNDWGFFGTDQEPPGWYNGKSWTA